MTSVLAPVRLNEVLRVARIRNASDVHLCAGVPPVLRVDGTLETQHTLVPTRDEIAALTASLLHGRAERMLDEAGDATVTKQVQDTGTIRVHAYRTANG